MNPRTRIVIAATAAAMLATFAGATPRAAEASGSNYIFASENLEGVHVGGYYRYTSRDVEYNRELSQDNIAFVVGLDLLDWFAIYGIVGTADAELDTYKGERDYAMLYGGGAWLSILDHDLLSNLSCETKFRISASAQMVWSSPDIGGIEKCDYSNFYGALTFSIVNELIGNKEMWPDALGVFAGPVWSIFDCDDYETEGDDAGFAVGLDIYVTRRVGLSASYETYGHGDNAVNFSLGCRF